MSTSMDEARQQVLEEREEREGNMNAYWTRCSCGCEKGPDLNFCYDCGSELAAAEPDPQGATPRAEDEANPAR